MIQPQSMTALMIITVKKLVVKGAKVLSNVCRFMNIYPAHVQCVQFKQTCRQGNGKLVLVINIVKFNCWIFLNYRYSSFHVRLP